MACEWKEFDVFHSCCLTIATILFLPRKEASLMCCRRVLPLDMAKGQIKICTGCCASTEVNKASHSGLGSRKSVE